MAAEKSMGIRPILVILAAVAAASTAGWFVASEPDEPVAAPKVHRDGKALGRATLEAVGALLRDDAATAKQALERVEAACRRLAPEEDATFGPGSRTLDQALHMVLGKTREHVGTGELDRAFDEFWWAQRTCRECHALARERGFLPAEGPLWSPDPAPEEKVKTTHSVGQVP
jgi:hypothetical protein